MGELIDVLKERKQRAQNFLKNSSADGWLICAEGIQTQKSDSNMEYLLGGRGTVALLTEDKLQVLVSSTEEALIPDYVDEVYTGAIWRKREFMNKLSDLLKTVKSKKLLLDNAPPLLRSHAIGLLSSHEKLIMNIGNMYDIEFDNAHNLVEELRTVKTVKEQEIIKKSVRKTEEILEDVVGSLNGEKTEKDVLGEIYKETYSYAFPSFPPIVAFGSHTASPHHIPENEKLKGNNIFLIDMGIKYASVCSDLTRTYFTSNPTKKQKKVYDTLYDALEIGISQVKAGISASKPALKAKEVIEENGFEVFGASHVLGHPVGAEVHDVGPGLSPVQEEGTKLKAGQILTFEPGLYYPEEGWGIRLEDNIIVKENKAVRLSKHPKEPVILNI